MKLIYNKTKIIFVLTLLISINYSQVKIGNYERLLKQDNASYYHVPIGLCEDYPEETTTMETIRKDFELLKNNGIDLLRISFGWDAIENVKDKYDWLFWDDFVKMAVEEYGITLVPYICYMPQWNSTGEKDTMFFWNYPPKDYKEFGQFMGDIVNRYKAWIKSWELWNEPDISIYWQGTPEQYSEFVKIGSEAVRKADPNAIIVLGGLAHNPEFFRQLFRDFKISNYVDVVNMHNYYETWSRHPIEHIDYYINEIAEIVQRYGKNQPLWMAEVGYSTWRMEASKVSDSYYAYYDYEHTPEYQAVSIFKTLTLALSTDKLAAIAWYEIKDLPMQENVIGDNNNRNLGVAFFDHKPKPGLKALSFFKTLFGKKTKNSDDKVIVTADAGSECISHAFETEDGNYIVTAWLQTTDYGERIKDNYGKVKDTRKENVSFILSENLKGKITLYDELGNGKDLKVERNSDGVHINNIVLEGGKILIIEIKK